MLPAGSGGSAVPSCSAASSCWLPTTTVCARERTDTRLLRSIREEAVARGQRHWGRFPVPDVEIPDRYSALAVDLDLFGRASLFQLVNTANTSMGTTALRDWMLEAAAEDEIRIRQQAVAELAPLQDFREQFLVEGRMLSRAADHPDRFVAWAEGERWLARRPGLRWLSRLSPALLLILFVLICAGVLPAQQAGTAMLGLVLANCLLSVFFTARVHDTFATLATRHQELDRYRALFQLLDDLPASSPRLQQVQREARAGTARSAP